MEDAGHNAVAGAVATEFQGLVEDDERIAAIRRELDERGVAELRGFLSEEGHRTLLAQLREREDRAAAGRGSYSIKGGDLDDTVVGELARSAYIRDFANKLLGSSAGRPSYLSEPIASDEIVPGVNIMRTRSDVTPFHFDGTYLNIILAVVIPKLSGKRRGQLVIYPNLRRFGGGVWGSYLAPLAARSGLLRSLLGGRRREVDYEERGAYLFYGYRSLHGVEAQGEDAFRAITNMTFGAKRFAAGRRS